MKKSVIVLFVSVVFLAGFVGLSSFKPAPADDPFIIVKTHESFVSTAKGKIIVMKGTERLKQVELNIVRPKHYQSNFVEINSVLNEIKSQGYKLVSTNSSSSEWLAMTNYIFEKE